MKLSDITPTDLERFWAKVVKTDTCWNWTAMVERGGYGRFRIHPDARGRMALAHRVSFAIANGGFDDSFEVDHICHNTRCVNPAHLRAATAGQNRQNRKGAAVSSKSGVRGVRWVPRDSKWRAEVTHMGVKRHVGMFETIEQAAEAARAKRNELFTHNALDRAS